MRSGLGHCVVWYMVMNIEVEQFESYHYRL